MRGASAVQQILAQNPDLPVRVFVVWEPILPTDRVVPGRLALGRITDSRAAQFWDPEHALAKQLKRDTAGLRPECCEHDGIPWDLVGVYPPGARWTQRTPAPVLWNGPVVEMSGALAAALRRLAAR